MIDVGLKFSGDLDAALDRFALDIQERVVIAGTAAAAKVMYDEAREQAAKHKKTGQLQDAIYRVYSKEKSSPTRKTYRISWNKTKAPHGHLIEFGTSRAPAYPFIRPAFDRVVEAIEAGKERMAERLKELGSGQ
jgi:HK97 gp10 family phage protein